ncbi:MAG: HEAT repeat domain-containing protein, partial [Planctomycetota bacterium]
EFLVKRSFEADRLHLGRLSLEERQRLAVESRREIETAQGEGRYRAIDTLGLLSDRAATLEIAKIAGDPSDVTAQWLAARALGRIADRRAVPALRRATQSPDENVRMWAYWALVRIAGGRGAAGTSPE